MSNEKTKVNMDPKYIIKLTVTLFVTCVIVAGLLGGVNAITKDKIAQLKQEKMNQAMKQVLPGVDSFEAVAFTGEKSVKNVYQPVGGDGTAYVVEVAPSGFGGEISMMVGIDGGKVTGVSVVSHAETAGLGAIAADSSEKGVAFRSQFNDKSGQLTVGTDIEAITGATITSKAVTDGVNAALAVKLG